MYWHALAWEEGAPDSLEKGWNKLLLPSQVLSSHFKIDGAVNDCSAGSQVDSSYVCTTPDSSGTTEYASSSPADGSALCVATSHENVAYWYSCGDNVENSEFRDFFQHLGYSAGYSNWQTQEDWLKENTGDPS